ncbi:MULTISPECIES: nuclear transport factor 2 family protein [unclassified Corynebacterium]|uniref:Polyketide cyclase n=1 Tax=Corynebacterium minutissimum TaxID=38301 RepID=A0ACC4UCD3_9CORY|nr:MULTISPECIES: nuclear transport factor 2 family protein [unclassified Corynebacterium]KKO80594.1 polyketide cyclase [Corynebacterium minutissimum]OFN34425.1 polyketide cyclase [Corynebacterium sp. HMSC072A04]OFQ54155.1 polyketide cyclase [Corynebacterium sp. HMSC074H12]
MTSLGNFVLEVHTALFDGHDTSVLDKHFADNFVEHSPLIANDAEGLKKFVTDLGEGLKYTNARVIADEANGLVALHGRFDGIEDEPFVGFDIYRVEGDKIVEHWDNLVPLAEPNASGRTQLDGATEIGDESLTEQNREFVIEFFTRSLIGADYSGFIDNTRDDQFAQHSPDIADGAQNCVDFLTKLQEDGEGLEYERIHRTVAQGQFVLTHSEGSIAGARHSYCELWRVEDGKLVEMWDAISEVPSDDEALHKHGIF